MKKGFFIITLFSFLISASAWAIEFEDAIYPELVTSSRALAMGNAFVAKANDSAAVFYNPAGLGSVRGWNFHVSNFHMEFSKSWINAGTSGKLLDIFGQFTKAFSLDGLRQLIIDDVERPVTSRFSLMPNFTTRYFSAGFLFTQLTRVQVNQDLEFEYADRLDYGPYAALNLSLFGGVIKVGAMGVLLRRSEAIGAADKYSTIELTDSDYSKGIHLNVTGGAKVTLPIAWLPTFAAKMHNVLQSDFGSASGAGAPETIKSTIDAAVSVTPQIGKITRLHMELDWRDVTGEYENWSLQRRLFAGMELDVARTLYFRLGFSDGFGSFGLGIRTERLQVDLATYARDLTAGSLLGKEDRRFALTLSSGI